MAATSSAHRHSPPPPGPTPTVTNAYLVILSSAEPSSMPPADDRTRTEQWFRHLAASSQRPKQRFVHRYLHRQIVRKNSAKGCPADSGSSPSLEQVMARMVEVLDRFVAARDRADKRNKAWAAGLTTVAFAAAIAFFATGNVIAGCAFLSVPVVTLIDRLA
jgi:hypothetical protein